VKYYVGIDGGGTKTEFVLVDESGSTLSNISKTGSNPNGIGIENSYSLLLQGLNELLQGKVLNLSDAYIFAGIAGSGVGDNAKILQEKLSQYYPNVVVESDLVNALEVCLNGKDGIAIICGTGISCCINENGATKIVGGYGYLFEDGGSGYAYGKDAVNMALKYEDGFGEKTILHKYLCEKFGKSVRDSLGELLIKGKFYVASLCPLVFKGYAEGDKVCAKIIEENLQQTIKLIKSALSVCKSKDLKIAFMGGVTKNLLFKERMQKEFLNYEVSFCEENPVMGAVRNAIKGEKKC
jgi:N-acetylglucosamine kinase-like BadF-type ATPase